MSTEELLTQIDKKLDKILALNTKIAKTLHLIPVTEKEERAIQIAQRKHAAMVEKVNADLDAMENKEDTSFSPPTLESMQDYADQIQFSDILGSDFLGGTLQ